jgi:hypothetical protein
MGLYNTLPVPEVLNARGIVDVDRIASMSFHIINKLSVVCRFGVEIKELQRQSFVSSLSASRVVRAGSEL